MKIPRVLLVAALLAVMLVAMAAPAIAQANDTQAGCGIAFGNDDIAAAAQDPALHPFGRTHVSQFEPGALGPIIKSETAQGCAGTR